MTSPQSFLIGCVKTLLPVAILAIGAGGFYVLSQKKPPPERKSKTHIPVVKTVPVTKHSGSLQIEVDGLVVPYREVTLAAEVAGRITKKNPLCRAGKYVAEGVHLFTIDPSDYRADVKQLEAEQRQLTVEEENTLALIKLAKRQTVLKNNDLTRQLRLQARGAASDAEVDAAKQAALTAEDKLQSLLNQQRLFRDRRDITEAKLDKAKNDLQRTTVAAPIAGVVVHCEVERNSHVQKGATLVTIEDTAKVEVKCQLRMKELAWLWQQENPTGKSAGSVAQDYQVPQSKVEIVFHLGNRDFVWEGKLWRYDGIGLDPKTRTIPCRVLVSNPRKVAVRNQQSVVPGAKSVGPPALVRGMFVTVRISARPRNTTLLRFDDGALRPGNVIWVNRNGKLDVVPVRVAQQQKNYVIVEANDNDLSAGDRAIVTPLEFAVEGMPVREEDDR